MFRSDKIDIVLLLIALALNTASPDTTVLTIESMGERKQERNIFLKMRNQQSQIKF